MRFNGPDYDPKLDRGRLSQQHVAIRQLMIDGNWRSLGEISAATGQQPEASVSAQLRHLRKPRFGGSIVEKRRRGDRRSGLFEYRMREPSLLDLPAMRATNHRCCACAVKWKEIAKKERRRAYACGVELERHLGRGAGAGKL